MKASRQLLSAGATAGVRPVFHSMKWAAIFAGAAVALACPLYVLDEPQPEPGEVAVEARRRVPETMEVGLAGDASAPLLADMPDDNWAAVVRGDVELYVPTMGNLRARKKSLVASQVAGRVEAVLAEIGDRVEAGQPLVRLDTDFYQIEVQQREAELEGARIALTDAELLLSRLSGLWNEGENSAIPRQTLDEAQARRDGMESRVRQAQESLSYSRKRLAETVVRAPYDGMITSRYIDPGESVVTNPVTPLLEIQETDTLELTFTLPQESLEMVGVGTPVEFRVAGVPDLVGRAAIEAVYPAVDEATRTFTCRALVDNPDRTFMPGMLAQVGVLGGRAQHALSVPRRSLTRQAEGWSVMVLRDGHPALQHVEVGLISLDTAEIVSGLTENDRVMVPKSGA